MSFQVGKSFKTKTIEMYRWERKCLHHYLYLIDWEFGHIGDPRSDLGYYTQIPMPPHLYSSDREGFLAYYRELTHREISAETGHSATRVSP